MSTLLPFFAGILLGLVVGASLGAWIMALLGGAACRRCELRTRTSQFMRSLDAPVEIERLQQTEAVLRVEVLAAQMREFEHLQEIERLRTLLGEPMDTSAGA